MELGSGRRRATGSQRLDPEEKQPCRMPRHGAARLGAARASCFHRASPRVALHPQPAQSCLFCDGSGQLDGTSPLHFSRCKSEHPIEHACLTALLAFVRSVGQKISTQATQTPEFKAMAFKRQLTASKPQQHGNTLAGRTAPAQSKRTSRRALTLGCHSCNRVCRGCPGDQLQGDKSGDRLATGLHK